MDPGSKVVWRGRLSIVAPASAERQLRAWQVAEGARSLATFCRDTQTSKHAVLMPVTLMPKSIGAIPLFREPVNRTSLYTEPDLGLR